MQRAIVCGYSSGLGLAMTKKLAESGYEVLGIARSRIDIGQDIRVLQADLGTAEDIGRAIRCIRSEFADFEVLIYCAGLLSAHEVGSVRFETLEAVMRVNAIGPMVFESELVDLIMTNNAQVINVTSSSIVEYYPALIEYSASKIAFSKFTSDLRRAVASSGARVMELCPSGFTSNMYVNMIGEKIARDESLQISVDDLADYALHSLTLPPRMEIGRIFVNRKP